MAARIILDLWKEGIKDVYKRQAFLQALYTTWDESFVPTGEACPGKYLTYVRRHGNEWFIGSMTIAARTMNVELEFLDNNKNYTAYIYSANDEGKLTVNTKTVTSAEDMEIALKEFDGVAIHIVEE